MKLLPSKDTDKGLSQNDKVSNTTETGTTRNSTLLKDNSIHHEIIRSIVDLKHEDSHPFSKIFREEGGGFSDLGNDDLGGERDISNQLINSMSDLHTELTSMTDFIKTKLTNLILEEDDPLKIGPKLDEISQFISSQNLATNSNEIDNLIKINQEEISEISEISETQYLDHLIKTSNLTDYETTDKLQLVSVLSVVVMVISMLLILLLGYYWYGQMVENSRRNLKRKTSTLVTVQEVTG